MPIPFREVYLALEELYNRLTSMLYLTCVAHQQEQSEINRIKQRQEVGS
jgi:hypothetical protein